MKEVLVSIVMPSYNGAKYISEAIDSVFEQSMPIELIIFDSCSEDGTDKIIKSKIEIYGDKIKYFREKDKGQTDAINKGFLKARGKYVGWLNTDDRYRENSLIRLVEKLESSADFAYGSVGFMDSGGRILRIKNEHRFKKSILLYYGTFIGSTSSLFKRSILMDGGNLLDDTFKVTMDYEFYMRLATQGKKFEYVPVVIADFRWHDSNISLLYNNRRIEEQNRVLEKYSPIYSISPIARKPVLKALKELNRMYRNILKLIDNA